jgi:hypothetical protein
MFPTHSSRYSLLSIGISHQSHCDHPENHRRNENKARQALTTPKLVPLKTKLMFIMGSGLGN